MTTRPRKASGRPKTLAVASGVAGVGVFFAAWGGLAIGSEPSHQSVLSYDAAAVTGTTATTAQAATRRVPVTRVTRTRTRSS